uniref:Ribonuclease kappa-A n=1 Tax=Ceratitis capitata TaxID=7213 RepID=RNKA_CERCA|nr:RecName: Full=Ribonuclease kappa-A; Short=RNase K-A; Short=RNase kappa-A; Flags: Precursor [Ceratitis capitata]CAB77385.1 ribonuclease [Ceratitis capitata]
MVLYFSPVLTFFLANFFNSKSTTTENLQVFLVENQHRDSKRKINPTFSKKGIEVRQQNENLWSKIVALRFDYSVWGIIQLVLMMGLFFYINSVALIEDLPIDEEFNSVEEFYTAATSAYNQNAYTVGLPVHLCAYASI